MYVVRYRIYNDGGDHSLFESVVEAVDAFDAQNKIYMATPYDTARIIFIHNTKVEGMYTRLVDEEA